MKTNKIVATTLATLAVLSLGVTSIYAYGGDGQGQGNGKGMGRYLTDEQRTELQSMSTEERQEYMQKLREEKGITSGQGQGQGRGQGQGGQADHSPAETIASIPASDLTDKEKEILSYGYSEEMVARDAYNYLYELYGEDVFKRIADSEQKHMDAVEALLDRYELDVPTGYGDLQSTFDTLKAQGEQGLKEALEVGIQIEILDIEDTDDAIKNTDNEDFKVIFTNIGGASYNHLRAFLNALDQNNLETDIDWSEFLSEDDLNTRGPLSYKLAERLEAEGVDLPEQVSSKQMKARKGHGSSSDNRGGNSSSMRNSNTNGQYARASSGVSQTLKNRYKNSIETKYQSAIDALDTDKLNLLLERIDEFDAKVANSTAYSQTTKQKYSAILDVLRDMVRERLETQDLDLEAIFN